MSTFVLRDPVYRMYCNKKKTNRSLLRILGRRTHILSIKRPISIDFCPNSLEIPGCFTRNTQQSLQPCILMSVLYLSVCMACHALALQTLELFNVVTYYTEFNKELY